MSKRTLSWNGARYELTGYPDYKGQFTEAGFHFDYKGKTWWTGLTEVAKKYEQYADDAAKKKFAFQTTQIELSKAVNIPANLPHPDGLEYLGFQKAGIVYATQRDNTLIADEMGLGKTVQAIGVCNVDTSLQQILLVCPSSLQLNWEREILKWMMPNLSGDFASRSYLPNSDIVIASYDVMSDLKFKIQERHEKHPWDLHIYDESHMLKNPEAKRTLAILGHENDREYRNTPALEARKRLFLTGTPILNRPVELWPMLRVIDPEGLGSSFWLFAKKFCGLKEDEWGRDFSGASNLDILQDRMRTAFMIRRRKIDVLTELPPKRRQVIPIPLPVAAQAVVQKELEFFTSNVSEIESGIATAAVTQAAGDQVSYIEAVGDLKGIKQVMIDQMSKLRHDTAVAKVPFIIKYLEDVLEEQGKIVLFAHHADVINPILEKFKSVAVKFDGTMSKAKKQEAVDRFQENPNVKLFIGSITAAGVGITLTAASCVIFAELDWRPGIVTQAEDRLHRIGQKDAVNVYHIVFDKSLDSNMAKKIVAKQEIIDQAIG